MIGIIFIQTDLGLCTVDWSNEIEAELAENSRFIFHVNKFVCKVLKHELVLVEDAEHVLSTIHFD